MKMSRSSGILAHPSSFPGKYGIGDLGESACQFIDFLAESGQSLWQILPLNPTGYGNSPYQSYSSFAGNALLLSPDLLLKDHLLQEEDLLELPEFDPLQADYEEAYRIKTTLFQTAYQNFINMGLYQSSAYLSYCKANDFWLADYALFTAVKNHICTIRRTVKNPKEYTAFSTLYKDKIEKKLIDEYYDGGIWLSWPQDILSRQDKAMKEYRLRLKEEIGYVQFLQYQFHCQWTALKSYANEKDIEIIGDIPIFVSLDSADVWANPKLFKLDYNCRPEVVAGVPPDYFSETGQLWGNPVYDWNVHSKSGYSWWFSRIKKTFEYCDIVRIDHFRGFQDYWEVPFGEKTAVNGKWVKGPGIHFFKELEKKLGRLPIIAEDLGILTQEVTKLRKDAGFPGMVILQFAFDDDNTNTYLPHNYESPDCVAYTGTHDNDTTLGWYQKADEAVKDFYRRYLNVPGTDPAWELIRLAYASTAAYCIIPVQDLMGLDTSARMNVPGVAEGNWQFRYTQDMLSEEITRKLLILKELFNR